MEITRKPPYPLTVSYSGLTPSTNYTVSIMNDYTADLVEIPVTSNVSGVISTPLPDYFSRYDAAYVLEVYEMDGVNLGDIVISDTLTINRPYADPELLAENPSDLADATMYEALARAIIDSFTDGFKYKREIIETTGSGTDYIASPVRLNKIVRVYENNVLVYDAESTDPEWSNQREYSISPDRSAITVSVSGAYNRYQSRPARTNYSMSDSFYPYDGYDEGNRHEPIMDRNYSSFPKGWDYVFVVEAGWPVIPHDIKQATSLLYNDLKCNNMPYMNSYIKEYESGQFTLKFDPQAFSNTGNKVVDIILSNYPRNFGRLGVV